MRRLIDVLLAVSCLTIIAVAALHGVGPHPQPPPPQQPQQPPRPEVPGYSPRIAFPESQAGRLICPVAGRLDVYATVDMQASSATRPHWGVPFVVVNRPTGFDRATNTTTYEEIWGQEFPDRSFAVAPGQRAGGEFHQQLNVPPGRYLIRFGIRRYEPGADEFGEPMPVPSTRPSDSASFWATVR
jgi:hypothetical protein